MLKPEIYDYDHKRLVNWLRYEAGSSNPDYFSAVSIDGLKLQQIPEEYANLLFLLRSKNIQRYLCLGIGNGGSFTVECFFMKETLTEAIAVDNLVYGKLIAQNRAEVLAYMQALSTFVNSRLFFAQETTDQFFKEEPKDSKYDAIFIDADHSYDGASKDYKNALNHINKGGIIIFHDINSEACPGIRTLWQEVKAGRKFHEFIHSSTCGIGVIEV